MPRDHKKGDRVFFQNGGQGERAMVLLRLDRARTAGFQKDVDFCLDALEQLIELIDKKKLKGMQV